MGRAMIRRLHLARLDPVVVLAGGVFAARDAALEGRVEDGIRRIARRATVVRLDAMPILGAALLGIDRLLASDPRAHAAAVERARATLGAWRSND